MLDHLEAVGIDIGGTNLRVARISSTGRILARAAERITRDPDAAIRQVIEAVRKVDGPDVVAFGAGIPGRVDARRGEVLSGGYLNFAGHDFVGRLEEALERTVVIDNDCNMALVAEIAVGAAKGRENVVMFTIGTGIGGAVVMEGKIVRGRRSAGQLGHVLVQTDGLPCACGRRGCVETTSSGNALRRLMAEAGYDETTGVEDLLAAERRGDGRAAGVLAAWARPLRGAVDSMVAAFDPEMVLLGGGLGGAAFRAVSKVPAEAPWYQCDLKAAELGDDAGVIGAGICALIEHHDSGAAGRRPASRRVA